MFGWEFPPNITGGLGTACYGLTKGLAYHNVDIIFVVPKMFGNEDQSFLKLKNAEEIPVLQKSINYEEFWKYITFLEVGSNLVPYMSPEEFKRQFNKYKLDSTQSHERVFYENFKFSGKYGADLFQEVARYAVISAVIAAKNGFDIIHAHDWLTYPAGIAAKEISGKPLVIHVHATEYDRSGENVNKNVYDIEKKGMMAADRIITVSHLTRKIVIEKYGIDPDKVITIHNAVEPTVKKQIGERNVDEKIVTFLGRITFQKGPEYFIEAANKIIKHDKNVRFVMAGSGDMFNKMIKMVAKLGISDKFHFTGFLQGEDVDRMLQISDVYVMPSVSEPFGISPLEAMQANVPVIISKQSGVAEVLNYAIKVDFWDIDAIANSIYGLLHYEAIGNVFRKHGKQEVLNLKWEYSAKRVKSIYESLLNK